MKYIQYILLDKLLFIKSYLPQTAETILTFIESSKKMNKKEICLFGIIF
jgi:hypothetical protein